MAALDFPPSPVVGDKYPVTPVPGQPQYTWDGEKWTTTGAQVTSASPSNNLPLMDATPAVPGVGTQYSREDHVHPTDTSRAADTAVLKKVPQTLTVTEQTDVRKNVYAAPFDALAYNGMQINGSMEVSQENGSTPVTVSGKVPVDGWYLHFAGTMAVSAFRNNTGYSFPGTPNALTITVQTAQASLGTNDFVVVQHYIEGYRIARLEWGSSIAQPITLGFWTGHHRPGTYTGVIRNGAFDRGYAFTYTQNVADAAEYKTITIPGCPNGTWLRDNGVGMRVCFAVAAGAGQVFSPGTWISGAPPIAGTGQVNGVAATSDVFHITNLVVLPGVEAPSAARSPLIMRPYDQELETCQRYFRSVGGNTVWDMVCSGFCVANNGAQLTMFFEKPMRAAPSFTMAGSFGVHNSAATGVAVTSSVISVASIYHIAFNVGVASGLIVGDATKLFATTISMLVLGWMRGFK